MRAGRVDAQGSVVTKTRAASTWSAARGS